MNNIYQDSKHYGPRDGEDVFQGWLDQWRDLQRMRPYCTFNLVHDDPPDFLLVSNPSKNIGKWNHLTYKQFNDTIEGLTIYVEEKQQNGILKNIFIR